MLYPTRNFLLGRLSMIGACVAIACPAMAAIPPAMTGGAIPTKVRIRDADARGLDRLAFARWLKRHPGMEGLDREDAELSHVTDDSAGSRLTSAMFDAGDSNNNGYLSAEELKDILLKKAKYVA